MFEFHVAPLFKITNRHFRVFLRQFTHCATLWTEMISSEDLLKCQSADKLLAFDKIEHKIICQLGGNNAKNFAQAAKLVEKHNYDGININAGCPSTKIATNNMGIDLLGKPELIADIVAEVNSATKYCTSVKTRIGINENSGGKWLKNKFEIAFPKNQNKKTLVVIHARTAMSSGIGPKENRSIPPIEYDKAIEIANTRTDLDFVINGNITTLEEALHFKELTRDNSDQPLFVGVMLGRAASRNPCMLAHVDKLFYGKNPPSTVKSRKTVLEGYLAYIKKLEQVEPSSQPSTRLLLIPIMPLFYNTFFKSKYNQIVENHILKYSKTKIRTSEILRLIIDQVDAQCAELFNKNLISSDPNEE